MRESNARGCPPVLKVGAGKVTYVLGGESLAVEASSLLVAAATVVGAAETAETDGAGSDAERARDDFAVRATGKQISSRTRREKVVPDPVRRGPAQTVTSALGSLFVTERAGGSTHVAAADVVFCRATVVVVVVDDEEEVGWRSGVGVEVDLDRDI